VAWTAVGSHAASVPTAAADPFDEAVAARHRELLAVTPGGAVSSITPAAVTVTLVGTGAVAGAAAGWYVAKRS
jgi:hypothetical protein